MNYKVTKDNQNDKEIEITLSSDQLNQYMEKELNNIQKDLAIKGFRKGKVPRDIILSRYKDTLKAQAMSDFVNESFIKILKEQNWQPASQAELVNVNEDKDITITLKFETLPNFQVDKYRELEVFKEKSLPDDYLLDQAIKRIQEQNAAIREINRPAAVDDIIEANLRIIEDGKVKATHDDIQITVGDRTFPDEINRALVGVKVSERKEITVDNKKYIISIKKIKEKILPQIDDTFAKQKDFENEKQLRDHILKLAKQQEEKRQEDEIKEKLSEILLQKNSFSVPDSMVQQEYDQMLKKMNLEDSDSNKERFWNTAEKRVRLNLILDKIALKENVTIKQDDIIKVINTLGIKTEDANRKQIMDYIDSMLKREKAMDFIYKNANINQKSRIITPKEAQDDASSVRHRTNRPR